MSEAGLFTAGESGGHFNVRALADGIEAVAEVRVSTEKLPPPPPPPPGEQIIRWRGVVPTQKWMNFYTKVLTRFATTPEHKLEVASIEGCAGFAARWRWIGMYRNCRRYRL